MPQRCVKCGRVWPDALVDKWGQDGHGEGYGPNPVCVGLRPSRAQRGAPDPQEACKGTLTSSTAQIDQKGTQVNGKPVPPAE